MEKTQKLVRSLLLTILFLVLSIFLYMVFRKDDTLTFGMQQILYPIGMALLLSALVILWLAVQTSPEKKARRHDWFQHKLMFPLLAGALAMVCTLLAYFYLGIWPVGDKTVMIVDMHHQYAPLLAQLREMILSGGSPLYSFKVGLGSSFIPLFAYYLASPFNLLLLLFPEHLLTEGIFVITILKNTLCAIFFAACVQYIYRKRTASLLIVSVMYALMMYALAYSWNIMWLDCVMVLPLVVMGFERLMRTGRYGLYVLSLAYALYANYYIAFMICLFMVLYYIVYTLRRRRTLERFGRSFLRFSVGSLLGGGLAMFILIPVLFALGQTSASGGEFKEQLEGSINMFQLLGRHLYDTTPTIRSGNLPNIYCGLLAVLAVPLFATTRTISLRRRLSYLGLLGVLALSFAINNLDLLWHGLHAPNDLPYRFSFLYSFVLLLIVYETLLHLKDITIKQVGGSFVGILAYLILEDQFGDQEAYGFKAVYISLLLVAIYALIVAFVARHKLRVRSASCLLLLVVVAEMTFNAGGTFRTLNSREYFTAHENYVDNERTQTLRKAIDRAKSIGAGSGNAFYRMELDQTPRFTCLSPSIFDYRGLSVFASSNYYTTTKFMGYLGYAINGVNSYLYNNFVPTTDSLFGIRYLVLDHESDDDSLKLLDTVSESGDYFYIYENSAALPVGYTVKSSVRDWYEVQFDPFRSQNDLFNAMTGINEDMFSFMEVTLDDAEDSIASLTGLTSFSIFPRDGINTANFTVEIPEKGRYFVYLDCGAASSISCSVGDASPREPYILDAGVMEAGDVITASISADSSCIGNVYVAKLNEELYARTFAYLSAGGLKTEHFSETRITGTFTAQDNGVFFTSIPYDEGWSVKVDGKAVEPFAAGNGAMLAFNVTAGDHRVEITFFPRGLMLGIILSLVSLTVFVTLVLVTNHGRRKRIAQARMAVRRPEGPAYVAPGGYMDYPADLSAGEFLTDIWSNPPDVVLSDAPSPETASGDAAASFPQQEASDSPSDSTEPPVPPAE